MDVYYTYSVPLLYIVQALIEKEHETQNKLFFAYCSKLLLNSSISSKYLS